MWTFYCSLIMHDGDEDDDDDDDDDDDGDDDGLPLFLKEKMNPSLTWI